MTPKLNRNRPFGKISGYFHGALTEQDNHYFGSGDAYLFSQPDGGERYVIGSDEAGASAPVAQTAAPLQPAGAGIDDGLDLQAWARGELSPKPQFFKVKQAVAALDLGIDVTSAETIKAGLVEQGIISEDE